jgi:hypothetical protein
VIGWGRELCGDLPTAERREWLRVSGIGVARKILTTFARFVDRGMLPNRFPDASAAPEYNTVDATLWYVEDIRAYHTATGDDALLKELYPVLEENIRWHREGTRYSIKEDPADGLPAGTTTRSDPTRSSRSPRARSLPSARSASSTHVSGISRRRSGCGPSLPLIPTIEVIMAATSERATEPITRARRGPGSSARSRSLISRFTATP